MAKLHTSGAISLNQIKNFFGGPSSPSLANYRRGGSYVPSSKAITVRVPASGQRGNNNNRWVARGRGSEDPILDYLCVWDGSTVYTTTSGFPTSVKVGNFTYWRGSSYTNTPYGPSYGIYRTNPSTTAINTGIPTSGTIALSHLYGAEKP